MSDDTVMLPERNPAVTVTKSRLPWLPLYVDDFLTSETVQTFSGAEAGFYIRLLCHQWRNGSIPSQVDACMVLAGARDKERMQLKNVLERCFVSAGAGRLLNPRLDEERQKQERARHVGVEKVRQYRERNRVVPPAVTVTAGGTTPDSNPAVPPLESEPKPESKPKKKRTTTTAPVTEETRDGFDNAMASYPQRAGSISRARAAEKFGLAVRRGVPVGDLVAGVLRYAAFVRAVGKEGTEYVYMPQTFFGPQKLWQESWTLPRRSASGAVESPETQAQIDKYAAAFDTARA